VSRYAKARGQEVALDQITLRKVGRAGVAELCSQTHQYVLRIASQPRTYTSPYKSHPA
jgi:hypothetical protein